MTIYLYIINQNTYNEREVRIVYYYKRLRVRLSNDRIRFAFVTKDLGRKIKTNLKRSNEREIVDIFESLLRSLVTRRVLLYSRVFNEPFQNVQK